MPGHSATAESSVAFRFPIAKFVLPPFLSGFSVSVVAHFVLITGGVWFAHTSSNYFSGPAEFEVVGVDAAYMAGVNVQEKKAKAKPIVSQSAIDEAVLAQKKAKPAEQEQSGQAQQASQGEGGTASQNIGTSASLWQHYGASVRQCILDHFKYPSASRSLGETGRVKVAFSILADGQIVDVHLKNPSAFERLNTAAVDMVQKVQRVAVLPVTNLPRWDTEIAIDFMLN